MARVVCETDKRICESASIRAFTRLVLPAPDGAEMMYRVPVLWVMSGWPYSIFCTCSRICSINTLRLTAAWVLRGSKALEPSVLASRLSSCIRKYRRRPAWPPVLSTRRTSVTWVEAIEFFGDIAFLCQQDHF